jgi:hypothetical protein
MKFLLFSNYVCLVHGHTCWFPVFLVPWEIVQASIIYSLSKLKPLLFSVFFIILVPWETLERGTSPLKLTLRVNHLFWHEFLNLGGSIQTSPIVINRTLTWIPFHIVPYRKIVWCHWQELSVIIWNASSVPLCVCVRASMSFLFYFQSMEWLY